MDSLTAEVTVIGKQLVWASNVNAHIVATTNQPGLSVKTSSGWKQLGSQQTMIAVGIDRSVGQLQLRYQVGKANRTRTYAVRYQMVAEE